MSQIHARRFEARNATNIRSEALDHGLSLPDSIALLFSGRIRSMLRDGRGSRNITRACNINDEQTHAPDDAGRKGYRIGAFRFPRSSK
jgi:hypothetical protein